jgi:hypothetical protein
MDAEAAILSTLRAHRHVMHQAAEGITSSRATTGALRGVG